MAEIKATIDSISKVAEKTYQVILTPSLPLVFKSGQAIKVCLHEAGSSETPGSCQNFLVASAPKNGNSLTILVRETNSHFEQALLELRANSSVTIHGPHDGLRFSSDLHKESVFVASGVGIAPFMSLLRNAGQVKFNTPTTLLYAVTKSEPAVFVTELNEVADKSECFQVEFIEGEIGEEFIKSSIHNPISKKWFICGAPDFVLSVVYRLREMGVPETDIVFEQVSGYGNKMNLVNQRLVGKLEPKLVTEKSFSPNQLQNFSEPSLRVLSELALVVVTDIDTKIVYVNENFLRVSKYAESEILGKKYSLFGAGKYTESYYAALAENIITKGGIFHEEMSNYDKDGSVYWVDASITAQFDSQGKAQYFVGVGFLITDKVQAKTQLDKKTGNLEQIITEMKVKEEELENTKRAILNILEDLDEEKKAVEKRIDERTREIEQEKQKLQQVTKNIKDGVMLLNSNGELVFANEALYQLFNLKQESLSLSATREEVFSFFNETNFNRLFAQCLAGEIFTVPEIESQGKIFEIYFNNLMEKSEEGDDVNYFILFSEVTDAKLLERSKSELVAVASHQLRTPLTAMRGNIEMLIDESYGPLSTEQHELLADVDVSTNRLISMVNDMLDITKIERGSLDMVLENVSIKEVIDSICYDLLDYAKRRGVTLEVEVSNESVVYVDRSRVRQVLQNLIDNAIKYSRNPGLLKISERVEGDFVTFTLKDNGLGIPKIEHSKIFNRFYRATNVNNSTSSGSGLGLYIVKSIVEQMCGRISFESEEGIGTTFYVSLPKNK